MTIHSRYLDKYGYRIERSRIREIKQKYIYRLYEDSNQITVPTSDWVDFQFLVRVNSPHLITKMRSNKNGFVVDYTPKQSGLQFRVIKEINSENHPWIDDTIQVGKILRYSVAPMYGVVNLSKGFPVSYKGGSMQINYDFVEYYQSP